LRIGRISNEIFERYVALAREAAIADDRIAAENLYQHAEHYLRNCSPGVTAWGYDSGPGAGVPQYVDIRLGS